MDKHSSAIISPRLALMWSPLDDLRSRLSLSMGFLAPRVFDDDLYITQVGGEGAIIRNDPELEEEKSMSLSFRIEYTPEIGDGLAQFDANGFLTLLDDSFSIDQAAVQSSDGNLEFIRSNRGGAEVYGVELNVGYGIEDLFQCDVGYVEQRSKFDEADPDFGSRDFFRVPDRYGQVKVTMGSADRVGALFLGLRYTGEMKAPHYAGYISEDRLKTTDSFIL